MAMLWIAARRNLWKSSIEVEKFMTVKKKKKSSFGGGRAVTIALSLCLLAIVTMIGMYTVGKTDQQQEELEQQVAQAQEKAREQQEAARAEAEARRKALEEEAQKQAAASASAKREKEVVEKAELIQGGAELESEFKTEELDLAENLVISEIEETSGADVVEEQPTLSFSPEQDRILWPVAGNIILDYSMDKTVYFATLDQYKYNPAVIIQGSVNEAVMCGAQGRVTSIETLEETGTTVTLDIGDGYELIYGQLKELPIKEGDYLKAGETVGYVSEPTRFYSSEGANVYFEIRKDGTSVDPMTLFQ